MALLWLFVAVGLTGWAVQRSARVGRLAAPPRYDDIQYFNAALRWVHRWNEFGPLDALTAFLQDPPRAPFPELLAAGAFAIGGVDLAVPYLASFFIPWVALLWVGRFASRAMTIERLLIGLYVCTIPLLTVGVTQFRPDPFWGIVLGGAMGLLLTEQIVGATTRHLIAVGASFGVACLIKTSTFPVTAAALCAGVVLGAIADRYARPADWSWRAAIRSALIIGATAARWCCPTTRSRGARSSITSISTPGSRCLYLAHAGRLVVPPHLLQLRGSGPHDVRPPRYRGSCPWWRLE